MTPEEEHRQMMIIAIIGLVAVFMIMMIVTYFLDGADTILQIEWQQ